MPSGKVMLYNGRPVRVVNPSEPCACGRGVKPVSEITDRAKRYRANSPACRPGGPKQCVYCGSRRSVGVHHMDGNEDNGKRSNLAWACKSCNGAIAAAMKRHGMGKRTRQFNPDAVPTFRQYVFAINRICRKRDQAAGRCSPSNDAEVLDAVAIIRATPSARRRQYAKQQAAARGRYRDEVPF